MHAKTKTKEVVSFIRYSSQVSVKITECMEIKYDTKAHDQTFKMKSQAHQVLYLCALHIVSLTK